MASFFSDDSGASDAESRRRLVSLPKAISPGRRAGGMFFDDSDLEDAITLGSPSSPSFQVQGAPPPAAGALSRRPAPGFFHEESTAEAFDTFAEALDTPDAPQADSSAAVQAKPKAKAKAQQPPAKAKGAPKPKAERPPSSPARSQQSSRASSPATGRPRPGALSSSLSESVRAAKQAPASQRANSPARSASPRVPKARSVSPAGSHGTPKASAPRVPRSTSQRGAIAPIMASTRVPKAKMVPKAKSPAASLEVPKSPSRSRSPGRPPSRSPTFPRSPSSDARERSPVGRSTPSPSPRPRVALVSPRRPPGASPKSPLSPASSGSARASPKAKSFPSAVSARPKQSSRNPQRQSIMSPSSSEGSVSPSKEKQLLREVQRKQKELDSLKKVLEDEQVKAERREDEVSSLQRRRQTTWDLQQGQWENEWVPMMVEDQRGQLLHQVSMALAQTKSSLHTSRAQVRNSVDHLESTNQNLHDQVALLEQELRQERKASEELRAAAEELQQRLVSSEWSTLEPMTSSALQAPQEWKLQMLRKEEAVEELQATLRREQQQMAAVHEEMRLLQDEVLLQRQELQSQSTPLETVELKELRQKLQDAEARRRESELELNALRSDFAQGGNGLRDESEQMAMRGEVKDLRMKLRKAEGERGETEEELSALQNEVKALRRAVQESKRRIQELEQSHEDEIQVNDTRWRSEMLLKEEALQVKSSGLASELAREQLTCQRLQEASLTAARQKELLDDELQALKGEAKDLRLDGRRLLLRSSFQMWRGSCLARRLVSLEESHQQASVQHNSERSSQDGKVKEAFRRASQAERDAASEKFACQRLQEELREAQQQLDAEAIIQKSKAAAQEALIETQRMERARLEEQLAMVRCKSEETQEACAAREAMRCAEVQAQLLAQAEISESRREVAQLRAELSCRATEMSSLPSHLWRSPVQEDSLTHALIHASMGVRSMSNGYHNSVNSSWESIKVRPRGQEKYMTLLQSSSGAVASLLKQVRRLDDAHRTLSTGRNAVLGATPAQLRAVQALEKQTSMLERTNQEWTASFGFHSMEDLDDDLARQSGISVLDDEVSASERGAAMVRMLRRTEGRLERLQDRLQGLLSSPVSRRESPRRSPPEGW
ncbi:unnamed protein product [Durusdinium trenchii]|uniref:Uncharacterized protein n=1 Tax=Durusdinium trenchii TaxID=1381693 RepID=A0ABP0IF69_9DINO